MKAIILTLAYLFTVGVEDKISFERMKLVPYNKAYSSTDELLFVWVNYEELQVYQHLIKQYPKAAHCFVEKFEAIQTGIVIGRKSGKDFRRELDAHRAKPEEVIRLIDQVLSKKVTANHVETTVFAPPTFIQPRRSPFS